MDSRTPHTITPARFKPGVTLDDLPQADAALASETTSLKAPAHSAPAPMIRGQALIFWDPKRPGKKLDAIDTDQITPAKDCVSESLDALDEKWKEGAFRYLMPDFRKRVQAAL